MTRHSPLLVETMQANPSKSRRELDGIDTQHFDRRQGLGGDPFEERFKAIAVEHDACFAELAHYGDLDSEPAWTVSEVAVRCSSPAMRAGRPPRLGYKPTGYRDRWRGGGPPATMHGFRGLFIGVPSAWKGLRRPVFLGSEACAAGFARAAQRVGAYEQGPTRTMPSSMSSRLIALSPEPTDRTF
jgi:hypothetical protein